MNHNELLMNKVESLEKALKVLTQTEHIRAYLAVNDPKSLEQAETALGVPEFMRGPLNGPLVDLRDTKVILEALRLYVNDYEAKAEVESLAEIRRVERAKVLITRMSARLVPLTEREDKILAEEAAKEERKGAMMDNDGTAGSPDLTDMFRSFAEQARGRFPEAAAVFAAEAEARKK